MILKLKATMAAFLPLFAGAAMASSVGNRDTTTAATASNSSTNGVPAMMRITWKGYLDGSKESLTFYGNSVEDIVAQVHRYGPGYDTASIASEISYGAFDNGQSLDLPDIGSPPLRWRGPGGPWEDYSKGDITYSYTCGLEGTADWYRTKDGANKLRNMHTDMAFTKANSCARHWCYDTTAMYVCNDMDTDLTIPYYNIGWMTDGLDRLCCDDDYGKSGRMWHYRLNYSVVLGYGNCNNDPTTSVPYPQGAGNNGVCNGGSTTIWR